MEDMQEIKDSIKELNKSVLNMSASISKMESAIFDSIINNNYGLLRRTFDMSSRLDKVEKWQYTKDTLETKEEKQFDKNHVKWGVVGQWAAIIVAAIIGFFSGKHQ